MSVHLARPQRREVLGRDAARLAGDGEVEHRLLDRLVGEAERAPVMAERARQRRDSCITCTASSGLMWLLRMNQRGS